MAKLTWAQTQRLQRFVQSGKIEAEHRIIRAASEDERAFYRQIIDDATELLRVMLDDRRTELAEPKEEGEEDTDAVV